MSLLGTTVGRIRLVDHLGKGGMGEVLVGYDETLDRKVAVKCVRVGPRLSDKVKVRFLQEARILSRLGHPNICQIYDFVEGDGRDFLVMELVEGRSLKQAAEAGLDRKTKLEIAQRVADVLVGAHAEGVVHRDLKPEHVMITEPGEVKVLDFGVAHSEFTDHDLTMDLRSPSGKTEPPPHKTRIGSVVGTPRYMSPEQARGEPVTPASDMYTFGLLLQELFTGDSPYSTGELRATLAKVGEGHNRPTTGLDWPLTELIEGLKALTPGKRPTARETAEQLRFIRETPMRRLRRGVAIAALVLLVAGVAKYTVDLRRERSSALAARNQAEDLVTFMLEDLAEELRPVGKLEVLEKVARKALSYYEQASPTAIGDAAYRRGRSFYRVAEVLDDQGDLDAALEATRTAVATHQRLVDEEPQRADWQNGLANDHLQLAHHLLQRGERGLALDSLTAGRDIAARLVELDPENVEWRQTLGEAYYGLGLYDLSHDREQAGSAFRRAISIYRRLADSDPTEWLYKYRLAVFYGQGLGQVYLSLGREAESFAAVQQAYACYEELDRADPSNSRWQHGFAWENRRLGQHLQRQGRLQEALASYRRAQAISERLLSLEPSQVNWQLGLGADFSSIGGIQARQGELDAALESYRRALAISQRLVDTDPAHVEYQAWLANDHVAIGSTLARLGHRSAATAAWERALELLRPLVETLDDAENYALETQAVALLQLQRLEEARPVVERLRQRGWFEGSADDELVTLCRRLDWL